MQAAAMADLDAKVRAFLLEAQLDDSQTVHHTFAQRAESYYQKRPHLLSLLRHLHSAYLCLLHSSTTHHHTKRQQRQLITLHRHSLDDDENENDNSFFTSDDGAESTLSTISSSSSSTSNSTNHNPTNNHSNVNNLDNNHVVAIAMDAVVTEMVIKGVEFEITANELGASRVRAESSLRRCELQGSLVEVLESERRVLASENSKLRWRAAALAEETEGLAAESAFLRRRVGELAGALRRVKRDEGRMVVVLTRRVEELRKQINGMEKWRDKVVVEDRVEEVCVKCKQRESGCSVPSGGEKAAKWWEKVRGIQEFFLCGGPPPNCSVSGGSTN